ncbi:MAG: MBL fold metallo-hydrolase [Actinomycetia bacterium]|nr:MBL fold metallo-hydrolase [Actinomycetes bacterium]
MANMPSSPYQGGPGMGISLPEYFKPTEHLNNNNFYFPGTEILGADEMRVSFVGSCPWPPRRDQAGTSIMVELGNGDSFFFDLGNGSVKNILAMGVPPSTINDIFISHLHVDHYADLPYMLPFTATTGRWHPLRVYGPSGRTSELGTAAMVDNMKKMLRWHLEEFDTLPIGDGYDVEVTEFDFREENGICYQRNGVTVRHWPRSHGKDGASAYRLDWEDTGLSFVWTGDGRPDELTVEYAAGADVFVSEVQSDLGFIASLKYGYPQELYNYIIDTHHTPHYALGYLFKQVNPRIGMATHLEFEHATSAEIVAGVRAHWDGLFVVGAPDVQVVNVTRDAVWAREAVLPGLGAVTRPRPDQLAGMYAVDGVVPEFLDVPPIRIPREEQQDVYFRDIEIDADKYMPPDVARELINALPQGLQIPLRALLEAAAAGE